uniref:Uncharacterized protein n=1 Tax=Romanomermis culicivorax TaxID=13658 RepID=A0A915KD64_ROMCU
MHGEEKRTKKSLEGQSTLLSRQDWLLNSSIEIFQKVADCEELDPKECCSDSFCSVLELKTQNSGASCRNEEGEFSPLNTSLQLVGPLTGICS